MKSCIHAVPQMSVENIKLSKEDSHKRPHMI